MSKPLHRAIKFSLALLCLAACSHQTGPESQQQTQLSTSGQNDKGKAENLLVVDCLLPGQVRKLGSAMTFVTQRRPIRTSGLDCGIRGGEYIAYDRADYRTALNVWLASAMAGDAKSQVYVGEIFEKGLGTVPDHELAATWYRKAAQQGDSRGAINLGYLYEKGLGVKQDTVAALNWYRKASGLNDDDLQFASTIEAQSGEQFSQLQREIARGQKQRSTLEQLLEKKHQQLQREQQSFQRSQRGVEQLKQELSHSQSSQQPSSQQVLRLEGLLASQKIAVAKQRQESALLKAKLENQQILLGQAVEVSQLKQRRYDTSKAQQQVNLDALSRQLSDSKTQLTAAVKQLKQSSSRLSHERDKNTTSHQQLLNSTREKEHIVQQLEADIGKHSASMAQLESNLAQEVAKTKALKKQLQQKSSQQQRTSSALNKQHRQSQQALTTAEGQLDDIAQRLAKEKHTSQRALAAAKVNLAEVRRLQVAMIQRKAELETQRRHISHLESEMATHKTRLKTMPAASASLALQGPSIEILDPPITLTRGIPSVQLRAIMKERMVTGKVLAPSGLITLSINDEAMKLDKYGVFRYPITISQSATPVSIVAVDKRGKSAKMSFKLLPKPLASASQVVKKSTSSSLQSPVDFGRYHALIIGNNNYNHFNKLKSAINDAREADKILREQYGFKTTVLLNADRYAMLSALNKLREELDEDDNLLIYYAGHGELDHVNQRGHWLPVDAEPNSTANWVSNIDITDILNAISARHIMVVADSCYSGTMTRSSLARLESGMSAKTKLKWFKVMAKTRSRSVLTSGGLKPVLDSGSSGHSIFANAFFEVLKKNTGILEGYKIYRQVSAKVSRQAAQYNIEQTPQYAPILHAGHEAGEFFFVPKHVKIPGLVNKGFNSAAYQPR
ncbi:hypothetical protein A9Q89_07070 [Gammaproteobacteria bacterium 53_120_T64]|nr:hypothetical protein A9Q89_07070 [Gammaproteobacteria bacterium 53_120_T64]